MSDFRIVPYGHEKLNDVKALWRERYSEDEVERRSQIFEWFALGNPVLDEQHPPYWLLFDGDRAIGIQGQAPWAFALRGQREDVSVAHDIFVSADYRGKGIGTILLKGVGERRSELTITLWANEASQRLLRNSGWTFIDDFFPYAKVYDPRWRLTPRFGVLAPAVAALARVALRARERLRKKASRAGYRFEPIDRFGAEFDELFDSVVGRLDAIAVRDSRYLNWKFVDKPSADYHRIAARTNDGSLAGYIVFCTREEEGERFGVLLDFLADPDGRAFPALVEHALELLGPERVSVVRVACTEPRLAAQLRELGFSLEREPLDCIIRNWQGRVDERWTQSARHWYLTFSDGDGDVWA